VVQGLLDQSQVFGSAEQVQRQLKGHRSVILTLIQ
jgi:hypothetical protein